MSIPEEEVCPLCSNYKKSVPLVQNWISCEHCNEWYHYHCLNLSKSHVSRILAFACPNCVGKGHETEYKRTSKRRKLKVDYVALNDGDVDSSVLLLKHPHIESFINFKGDQQQKVDILKGNELNFDYVKRTKLINPVKIPAEFSSSSGLEIPLDFNIDELINYFGDHHPIEVMDVLTQESSKEKYTLRKWRDYFLSEESTRDRILNVLSFEISDSKIGEDIKRPTYVEQVDLVNQVWKGEDDKPKVSKYCLMGVKNSYTDFHLDFAGTSVYYTVLNGSKQFILFPPTTNNLKKYVQWTLDLDLNSKFLGDMNLEKGLKIFLSKGDIMIIPSGWIHAVYTPEDTLVIGGNFLTGFNVLQQLKIIEIEVKTRVDKRFKFPKFERLMWLTAFGILQANQIKKEDAQDEERDEKERDEKEQDSNTNNENKNLRLVIGKDIDLEDTIALYNYLDVLLKKKEQRSIRDNIPFKIIGNKPEKFLKQFEEFIEQQRN